MESGGQGTDIKSGGSTGAGTPAVGTAASTPSTAQDGLSNSLPNISPLSPVGGSEVERWCRFFRNNAKGKVQVV